MYKTNWCEGMFSEKIGPKILVTLITHHTCSHIHPVETDFIQ